ncbi:poly(A) RNA polymerase, mitochondrial-like [Saccoglossus kowalevskii]|uniref:Poly(A) RNA polymerase, mitochondrial-like n=1 Tax=Saccoglossus kowalevskii TaxID=10224 RepID=A0ABM0H1G8_SACKO|nr:PREDICTED: poly(A) RNA polymerase, mitochondrial-like [Saccoglossus kowalevskii]
MATSMKLCGCLTHLPIPCVNQCSLCIKRLFSTTSIVNGGKITRENVNIHKTVAKKKNFAEFLSEHRDQANRSILVRLRGEGVEKGLINYCSQLGKLRNSFTYTGDGLYAVIEFDDSSSIQELLNKVKPKKSQKKSSFQSRLLNFSGGSESKSRTKTNYETQHSIEHLQINFHQKLQAANSVDEQMMILTKEQELADEDLHKRFLVCSLIEEGIEKIVPNCTIYPFGSTVNSFGKAGSDLDMYMELGSQNGVVPVKTGRNRFQMVFDTKSASSERAATQQTLGTVATFLQENVPHCVSVQRILKARCPIVKFHHKAANLQCDLSSNNSIATKTTELLYLYGNYDSRVRPLVFAFRHWARYNGITTSCPGPWITNFGITLMVIYFLQTRSPSVVPTLDYLCAMADSSDQCIVDDVNCTFLSDINSIPTSLNTQSLGQLMYEFFDFYARFNFQKFAISLRRGDKFPKPEDYPLYIENPFEVDLNVTRNVHPDQLSRIVDRMQEAVWLIEQHGLRKTNNDDDIPPWGLAALLMDFRKAQRKGRTESLLLTEYLSPIFQSLAETNARTDLNNGQMKVISKRNKVNAATNIKKGKTKALL